MKPEIVMGMVVILWCIAISYLSYRHRLKSDAALLILESRVKQIALAWTFQKNAVDAYLKGRNEEMEGWLDWRDEVNNQIQQGRSIKS